MFYLSPSFFSHSYSPPDGGPPCPLRAPPPPPQQQHHGRGGLFVCKCSGGRKGQILKAFLCFTAQLDKTFQNLGDGKFLITQYQSEVKHRLGKKTVVVRMLPFLFSRLKIPARHQFKSEEEFPAYSQPHCNQRSLSLLSPLSSLSLSLSLSPLSLSEIGGQAHCCAFRFAGE